MADDRHLTRIEKKIDDQNERLASIDITLATQAVQLAEHIKRSDMLEAKMEPVEKHVALMNAGAKIIAVASAIIGLYKLLV